MELVPINREEKKKATRDAIVRCALELFARHGYAETTVNQITDHAGVAKGTFFNYFESKEEVLCDIQLTFAAEELSKLAEHPGPIIPLVREFLMDMCRKLPPDRPLILALNQSTLTNRKLLELEKTKNEPFKEMLAGIIASAQLRGEINTSIPARTIADLAVQTYDGVLLYWGKGLGDDRLSNQMAISFELFFKGIAP
ncbi:TetR/AcrR family transcriptional regulator [Paenibacillus humicus]|uniref:TetR/AcrR family transcriptional regulator n=1 Tax=Paenibacillus humicus TaxID=412861 RepID=UPI003F18CFC9